MSAVRIVSFDFDRRTPDVLKVRRACLAYSPLRVALPPPLMEFED
jgi:hypothetical protein